MKLSYIKAESAFKPASVEIQKTTVYIRKDITEDKYTYDDGSTSIKYVYQEAALTHDEFAKYSSELMSINAVKGVDDSAKISNILNGQENGDNNQLIIMEAIADLYDVIATMM